MCLSDKGLVVGSYVPFCWGCGRQLCALRLRVGNRQLCAFQGGVVIDIYVSFC
jgi:hypothetical protein